MHSLNAISIPGYQEHQLINSLLAQSLAAQVDAHGAVGAKLERKGHHASRRCTPEISTWNSDKSVSCPFAYAIDIFQPFFRINDERPTDGFGLGLSLASRIIKLHNGQIQLHSEVQKGTLFVIIFPIH